MPVDPEPPDPPLPPPAPPTVTDAVVATTGVALANESTRAHGQIHSHCENCGTALQGAFCHQCGQHDFEFHRSFGHVFLDALESFFHFDAKLFRNFIALLFQPGKLSVDFNAGQRAAQMPPFRLYIFVSFLFFFLVFLGDNRPANIIQSDGPKKPNATLLVDGQPATLEQTLAAVQKQRAVDLQPERTVDRLRAAAEQLKADPEAKKKSAAKPAEAKSPATDEPTSDFSQWIEHQAERTQDPAGQRALVDSFLHSLPKMLLFCLPLFALYTRFLFRQSSLVYLQHLVIALHFHTFIYLWVMCRDGWAFLAGLPDLGLRGWVLFACNLWLALYPLLMLRRIFANSWKLTLFKTGVLALAYGVTLVVALATTGLILLALL